MLSAAYKTCPGCQARGPADSAFCPACGSSLHEVGAVDGDPYVGLVLADKYLVEELIGEGAMGRVYKARQVTLGKPFAVKILAPHLMNDEASAARFANEAHNCASLNHPNCISVVDYGRSEHGATFIVMEFVHGRPLEDVIATEHPLTRDRVLDLTLQILAALTEAHGLDILHRDLKPDNILVQQLRTHGEFAKVLDFGIAKLMDKDGDASRLTMHGMICGTPEYMSPEQTRGETLDARSDLYAVGVILYQMLTGRPPFESSTPVEVLHKHLHEEPIAPSRLLGCKPDPLEAVCLRALAKDPRDRFASALEFRDALVAARHAVAADSDDARRQCSACGVQMQAQHRYCPECGAAASDERVESTLRRGPKRGSGLMTRVRATETTAEVVVRNFPLPLVGRTALLRTIADRLERPVRGVQTIALGGPPGRGKTRLGDELALLAEEHGWRTHYVGPDPSGARTPLWPIRVTVAALLDLDPFTVTTRDLGRAANLAGLAFELLPGLAELFELEGPAHQLELAVRRRECIASAVGTLLSGGRGDPLLLLFDDVDGFDAPSREILRLLSTASANATSGSAVMLLCMSAETQLDWLDAEVHGLELLGAQDVEWVARRVTEAINPRSSLPSVLARHAPLAPSTLENCLRLIAAGVELEPGADERALVRARIEALEPECRELLEIASVLGESFTESDLVTLVELDPRARSLLPSIDRILEAWHRAGIVLPVRETERAFAHTTLFESVSSRLAEARRHELHHLAARETRSAARSVMVRAVHLVRAGASDAVDALVDAASRAERSFDDFAAMEYLLAALDACARSVPDRRDRRREIDLVIDAARVMRGTEASARALALVEKALSYPALEPAQQARLHTSAGQARDCMGATQEGLVSLRAAVRPAISSGDRALILETYLELGKGLGQLGHHDEAVRELREGLDVCTLGEGPRADVDLDLWRYLLSISSTLSAAGKLPDARSWCEHALWQAERRDDRPGQLRCHGQMARILRDAGQQALAEKHLARALEEARTFGDRLTTAQLLLERARTRAARGRRLEARRCCEEALRLAEGMQWWTGVEHATRALEMLGEPESLRA